MDKFFERFKPGGGGGAPKKSGIGNNLFNFGGGNSSFQGQGKALGGSKPGQVISVQLNESGTLGLKVEKRPQGSAIVSSVVPGSQAEQAGIQRGDVLCFAGSNGQEEILHDMFLELAKSNQRPLCFEVRRVISQSSSSKGSNNNNNNSNHASNASGNKGSVSAEAFARKQAVIAAAEAREKKFKNQSKPIPKKDAAALPKLMSTAERRQMEQERLARLNSGSDSDAPGPQSEAAKRAIEEARQKEAILASQLGYNPYETSRATAGQARNATVAVNHGAIENPDAPMPPPTRPPREPAEATRASGPAVAAPEPSPSFMSAYETTVTYNDHANVVSSFSILRKLVINATTKGQASDEEDAASAKFRRVRLGNAKIKAAVVDVEGAIDLMLSFGFQLAEEDGESILVFPPGDKGPAWLASALKMMEEYEKS